MERNHTYSLHGIHLNWQLLRDSPNGQIIMTAKYSGYTVCNKFSPTRAAQLFSVVNTSVQLKLRVIESQLIQL